MADKPDLDLSDHSGFSDEYLSSQTERGKKGFSTRLRKDLIEKLRAAAWSDDTSIQALVNEAVATLIQEREDDRGDPYEVQPTQKVN